MAVHVATYIDGFNLYNGLKKKHGRKYLWLDLQSLAASLLLPDQKLVGVSYFSARVHHEASATGRPPTSTPSRRKYSEVV